MEPIKFEVWFENCKDDLFECPDCHGSGEYYDDEDFDGVECCYCSGNGELLLLNMGKFQKEYVYKWAIINDLQKYCKVMGLDYNSEWGEISKLIKRPTPLDR